MRTGNLDILLGVYVRELRDRFCYHSSDILGSVMLHAPHLSHGRVSPDLRRKTNGE